MNKEWAIYRHNNGHGRIVRTLPPPLVPGTSKRSPAPSLLDCRPLPSGLEQIKHFKLNFS